MFNKSALWPSVDFVSTWGWVRLTSWLDLYSGRQDRHLVPLWVICSLQPISLWLISRHIHLYVKPSVSVRLTVCRGQYTRQIPPLNVADRGKYGLFYEGGFKWWVSVIAHEAVSWRAAVGRGHTRNHGGNQPSEWAGGGGQKAHPVFSWTLIRGWFLLCSSPHQRHQPSPCWAEQFYKPPCSPWIKADGGKEARSCCLTAYSTL